MESQGNVLVGRGTSGSWVLGPGASVTAVGLRRMLMTMIMTIMMTTTSPTPRPDPVFLVSDA